MHLSKKKTLKSIKSGVLSRGFSLAKVSINAGARAASYAVTRIIGSEEDQLQKLKDLAFAQARDLTRELGELKGTMMKAGQMFSMLGEYFLPPEANAMLKTLQSDSPPLEWASIEKQLKKELLPDRLAELEIEHDPIASASLGQVHRARRKSDGRLIALKIQYPGVDRAIEGDLKTLQAIAGIKKILVAPERLEKMMKEIKSMLKREVDYTQELEQTKKFKELLKDDPRYVVPEVFPEYSSKRVLATSFEEGLLVDSSEVLNLSQERRNQIGESFVDLFFREFFEWGLVQTDPHFGNYRVRLGENGAKDQLVLFDFGAMRLFSDDFLKNYYQMVKAAFYFDLEQTLHYGRAVGFMTEEDPPDWNQSFYEICLLFLEPFRSATEPYDWGNSDLPKRVTKVGAQLVLKFKFRPPPSEIIFLDRKMAGVFIFLSVLKVRLSGQNLLEKYLKTLRL